MPHLSIRVLGPFQVSLDGEPLSGFNSDKVRALLAYLASSPDRPHRRESLAGLLWPEFPERSARTNLRNALANLRHVIHDGAASLPFLYVTRQTIQFNGRSDCWLDAAGFQERLATAAPTSEQLEQALAVVRGPFLEGFTLADAAPFEEWLLLRREYFCRQVVETLDNLCTIYEGQGAYELALAHARRQVELEPWQEGGQRQVMRLLALSGHRSRALAHYENLCRTLQEELGAEPSAETKALHEAILSGELAPEPDLAAGPLVPVWNLPASATPFFGRVDELAALEAKLAEPDTRLVTLTGLGGSGKTRLAVEMGLWLAERDRQALTEQSPLTFAHGIVFVPCAALDSVETLAPAMADALRLRLEGGPGQLLDFLRRRRILLILDNLEQLPSAAGFLAEILRVATGVKILATSRERLQLHGEHVLQLAGLRYPAHDLEPSSSEAVDVYELLAPYPALQLLADGVQRVCSGSTHGSADLPVMLGICRLVDGLPLALELAAAWADVLSLNDILAEAQHSLDFLQVDWPDLPERHRSMRAVFDASWRRLDLAEQAAFSSLTVFRGGFTREAVGEVVAGAEAVPRLLAALVRKSFLLYDRPTDRYGVHELLRQYGAEKLAQEPAREAEAHDRHCAYYTGRLQRWKPELLGSRQQAALSEMEAESENIRVAWTWAVDQAQVERLDRATEGLGHFYWQSGRYRQAEAAFQAAAAAVSSAARAAKDTDKATCLRVQVMALVRQSDFQRALGERDAARRTQQQCLAILEDPALAGADTRLERAILSSTMARTVCMADYVQGRQRFEESFSLFRDLDLQREMAGTLTSWGTMSMFLGAYQDAKQRLEEGLAINRALGNLSGVSGSLSRLAQIAWLQGRFEEAELLAREGYATSLEASSLTGSAVSLLELGEALEKQGRFSEAHSTLQRSLALLSELGHHNYTTQAHSFLGSADIHLGRYDEASEHVEKGLALAREQGPPYCIGLNLLLLGCLELADGAHDRANQLLEDGVAVYRDIGQPDGLSWGLGVLAFAALGLGDAREARHHLFHAFQTANELGAVSPLLLTLPAMALLLADQGENERGVELYALASRYPFVAKSRWFEDVVGQQIAAIAATLPAERVAALEERGQARDLEATASELLAELAK
jgi:DNA-binding SARP family transcriptional activator/predicted ATPase